MKFGSFKRGWCTISMKVAVLVKLGNKKLFDKINPLLESKIIEKIFIVRSFYGPKHSSIEYMKIPQLDIMKNKIISTVYVNIRGFFYLLKKKPQLIITYYFSPCGIVGIIYGKLLRKKVISCIIGTDIKYFMNNLTGNISKKLLSYSDKIITTGSNNQIELKKKLYAYSANDKVKIIPNTINIKKERIDIILKRPNQFIFVGKLDKNKRIDIIIKSFHLFLEKVPDKANYNLLIVGTGPLLKDMISLAKSLNLSNNCKFLGFQNKVSPYYMESRFIVLASKIEGLPAVLIEGMNHGCIPITTNAGDISDLITSSNGFLISNDFKRKELIRKFSQNFIIVSQLPDSKLLKISENCINTSYDYGYEIGGENWKELIKSLD